MPIETATKVICDGCNKEITEQPVYPVYLVDERGFNIFFHDHDCLTTWVTSKKKERTENIDKAKKGTKE